MFTLLPRQRTHLGAQCPHRRFPVATLCVCVGYAVCVWATLSDGHSQPVPFGVNLKVVSQVTITADVHSSSTRITSATCSFNPSPSWCAMLS